MLKTFNIALKCFFFLCVVQKDNSHLGTKALNMRNQAQKGFQGIFVEIPHHQKGYLVYITHKCKIVSSYDVVFNHSFSSALAYTKQPYSESMAMWPAVSYIPYTTSSKEQTGNTTTITQFEEGNLLSEYRYDTKSGNKYDADSNIAPLSSDA